MPLLLEGDADGHVLALDRDVTEVWVGVEHIWTATIVVALPQYPGPVADRLMDWFAGRWQLYVRRSQEGPGVFVHVPRRGLYPWCCAPARH